jgi:hypothetical protein
VGVAAFEPLIDHVAAFEPLIEHIEIERDSRAQCRSVD